MDAFFTPDSFSSLPPERCIEFENLIKAAAFLGSQATGKCWEHQGPQAVVLLGQHWTLL